ncbi:MAG: hypothetical protein MZV63_63380 [Marinilabiliales bacterium]|nr:hypothetical protein [Marinilabiliales bacterium]
MPSKRSRVSDTMEGFEISTKRPGSFWKGTTGRSPQFPIFGALPGVGEYIAAAVQSIAFRVPLPVIDGNVLRVVSRLDAIDAEVRSVKARKRVLAFLKERIPHANPGLPSTRR